MDAHQTADEAVSSIAMAIGEPARTRMLLCLVDGLSRTSTELAVIGEVSPSTASVHLNRLKAENLVKVQAQGRLRYYSLAGPNVARALERLSVLAGARRTDFEPKTPVRLRAARTCYDHMAGAVAVLLHDRFVALRWIQRLAYESSSGEYELTATGTKMLQAFGVDLEATRALRRRFAYGCLDWSERRPHIGGALGAALLSLMLKKKYVSRDLDSRALSLTALGRREMQSRFGMEL
jgi:DNA-binding transcriptional ArsR family regulator